MKNKYIWLLPLLLLSCYANGKDDFSKSHHLGSITIAKLFNDYRVFKNRYHRYNPSEFNSLEHDEINVVVFFGTWCHDSKRELPRALKIFKEMGLDDENIELIAVGLDKKEPQGRASQQNLLYTPTFIFMKGTKEIGRIIEKPAISLERDIELIISSI